MKPYNAKTRLILIYLIIILPLLGIGYLYGIVSYPKELFPFPLVKGIYYELVGKVTVEELYQKVESQNGQTTRDLSKTDINNLSELSTSNRIVESLTVPFLATTYELNSFQSHDNTRVRGPGGGLCTTTNHTIVVGGQGGGILIELESKEIIGSIDISIFDSGSNGEFNGVLDVGCNTRWSPNVIYIVYQKYFENMSGENGKYQTALVSVNINTFNNNDLQHIWSSPLTGQNFAGRIAFHKKNGALISFSDSEPYGQIQKNGLFRPDDPTSLVGKVISIDFDSEDHAIYSSGHRNPQGLFIGSDGVVYETEHGPKGGDEFNILKRGGNYGWPHVTHGVDYASYRWKHGNAGRHEGFDSPIFSWVPSIAISNLIQLHNFHPSWTKDFLIASLKAQSLFRLRLDKLDKVEFVEQIWIGSRIRDLEETTDSQILLWTDDSKLIILTPAQEFLQQDRRTQTSILVSSIEPCLQCHHFEETNETHLAPSLRKIFAREIASDNFKYSDALKLKTGKWEPTILKQYLLDPQAFSPGTSMSYFVKSEDEASQIIEDLLKIDRMGQ